MSALTQLSMIKPTKALGCLSELRAWCSKGVYYRTIHTSQNTLIIPIIFHFSVVLRERLHDDSLRCEITGKLKIRKEICYMSLFDLEFGLLSLWRLPCSPHGLPLDSLGSVPLSQNIGLATVD